MRKLCPYCKNKLNKNGIRNGKQRWRCSNKNCRKTYTENSIPIKQKKEAISFFYDLLQNIHNPDSMQSFHSNKNVDNIIKKTKKTSKDVEIKIDQLKEGIFLKRKDFVIILSDGKLNLIKLNECSTDIIFKMANDKFEYIERAKYIEGLGQELKSGKCITRKITDIEDY